MVQSQSQYAWSAIPGRHSHQSRAFNRLPSPLHCCYCCRRCRHIGSLLVGFTATTVRAKATPFVHRASASAGINTPRRFMRGKTGLLEMPSRVTQIIRSGLVGQTEICGFTNTNGSHTMRRYNSTRWVGRRVIRQVYRRSGSASLKV